MTPADLWNEWLHSFVFLYLIVLCGVRQEVRAGKSGLLCLGVDFCEGGLGKADGNPYWRHIDAWCAVCLDADVSGTARLLKILFRPSLHLFKAGWPGQFLAGLGVFFDGYMQNITGHK